MDIADAAALLPRLINAAGLDPHPGRDPIRVWARSGVERLHLSGGGTVVFKYAQEPFNREHLALDLAARNGVPVPRVLAAQTAPGLLGILLEDLGQPVREAGEQDAAQTAVSVHRVPVANVGWLPRLDETVLAAYPARIAVRADPAKISRAREQYGQLSNLAFVLGDAAAILTSMPPWTADVCLSIFGAFSFSSPGPLLRAATHALCPGGRLAITLRADDHHDHVIVLLRKRARRGRGS